VSFPTLTGDAVEGLLMREGQSCLGPSFAGATYQFFLSGTTTPANVFQDGALTTPFPITGFVSADNFGRFPPIYLDSSVLYQVQFFDSTNTLRWTVDPYTPPLNSSGASGTTAFGFSIAPTGEVVIPAPNSGGTGITLTLNAGALGSVPLLISAPLPGASAIIVNSSATTGAQTATFAATNKPGTATSSPAGWLPITCDGVQYYTPIWHGNNFTPYISTPTALGEVINGLSVTFGGNGLTTAPSGTAVPGSWFVPNTAGIGAGFWIKLTKTSGLSGVQPIGSIPTATVAPSGGTYTGGTLTANFNGFTSNLYTIFLSTGQAISGCTFTNGSAVFTTPSTAISGTPNATLTVSPINAWFNISANGITFGSNAQAPLGLSYQLSTSSTGNPVVASGTMTIHDNGNVQQPVYNGATPLFLTGSGQATLNGAASSNWFSPTTANVGVGFWIFITRTGGTVGYNFSTATSAPVNISNAGLSIGISGPSGQTFNVSGTYRISSDSAGANVLGSGSITLTGGTNVQSPNWAGTSPLKLNGNGSATLNGVATSSWYSPNAANVGSGFWIKLARTSGTAGVNFSAAQGSWTNITNSGLTIALSGTSGDVGTVSAGGTWQISSSSTGTPVLGSGTISLSVNAGTLIHVYTTATTNSTETIPTGTTTVQCEVWGSGGSGGAATGSPLDPNAGFFGSAGGLAYSSYAASTLGGAGKTFKYTITNGGAGVTVGGGNAGTAGTITAGTVTGFSTMTGNGGGGGNNGNGAGGGPGGTATGGNVSNTTGGTGTGTGVTGKISGDQGSAGGGGAGAGVPGNSSTAGKTGGVCFFYS
jgi:hypothetical protein